MDNIKREELEEACKKIRMVRFRMVVVQVLNMFVEEIPASKYAVHANRQ